MNLDSQSTKGDRDERSDYRAHHARSMSSLIFVGCLVSLEDEHGYAISGIHSGGNRTDSSRLGRICRDHFSCQAYEQGRARDHARDMLLDIADDIDSHQSESEQAAKSKGYEPKAWKETSAEVHGGDRQTSGFSVIETVSAIPSALGSRSTRRTHRLLWIC